jgi:hypothetical protein
MILEYVLVAKNVTNAGFWINAIVIRKSELEDRLNQKHIYLWPISEWQ